MWLPLKTVTISRRNWVWRRASCRAMSNCFHLPWELLSTDHLCQVLALGSARSFSFPGKGEGVGVYIRPETIDLYTEDPSPDLGAWIEVTLQKARFLPPLILLFFFLNRSIRLLKNVSSMSAGNVDYFVHCHIPRMSALENGAQVEVTMWKGEPTMSG